MPSCGPAGGARAAEPGPAASPFLAGPSGFPKHSGRDLAHHFSLLLCLSGQRVPRRVGLSFREAQDPRSTSLAAQLPVDDRFTAARRLGFHRHPGHPGHLPDGWMPAIRSHPSGRPRSRASIDFLTPPKKLTDRPPNVVSAKIHLIFCRPLVFSNVLEVKSARRHTSSPHASNRLATEFHDCSTSSVP